MAWLKIDDNVSHHRKVLAAGDAGAWLWICGLAYCQRHASDGRIPREAVPFLGCVAWKGALPKVLAAGLWLQTEGGYEVHDFLEWNDSAADRDRKSSDRNARVTRFRERHKRASNGVGNAAPSPTPSPTPQPTTAQGAVVSPAPPPPSLDVDSGPPKAPRGRAGLVVGPGAWGLQHAHCVEGFCDFVCLRRAVFLEFVQRVTSGGAPEAEASGQVTAWAHGVRDDWRGRIPGDDIFAFWRNEWQRTHGSNRPASAAPRGAGLDALLGGGRG